MPSAPSRIALDQSSAPPSTIIAGVPTTKQPPAAKPTSSAISVIWFGVIGVR
jgi:hypothetical protein